MKQNQEPTTLHGIAALLIVLTLFYFIFNAFDHTTPEQQAGMDYSMRYSMATDK